MKRDSSDLPPHPCDPHHHKTLSIGAELSHRQARKQFPLTRLRRQSLAPNDGSAHQRTCYSSAAHSDAANAARLTASTGSHGSFFIAIPRYTIVLKLCNDVTPAKYSGRLPRVSAVNPPSALSRFETCPLSLPTIRERRAWRLMIRNGYNGQARQTG